jgi:hypothetical protein
MTSTVERPPADDDVADEVVVALSEALLVDGLADARWLLHDAVRAGARRIVVRGADRRTRDMIHRTGLRRVLTVQTRTGRVVA